MSAPPARRSANGVVGKGSAGKGPVGQGPVGLGSAAKTGAKPAPKPSRVGWPRLNDWFHRVLGLGWLVLGLWSWAAIIGVEAPLVRAFEGRALTVQALIIFFAVTDIVAAVGLWLLAPWGGAVWLVAASSRLVFALVFPAAAPLGLIAAAAILVCVVLFIALSWLATHREGAD